MCVFPPRNIKYGVYNIVGKFNQTLCFENLRLMLDFENPCLHGTNCTVLNAIQKLYQYFDGKISVCV